MSRTTVKNCPINERTGDGHLVGRCWHTLKDNVCPRHGDVEPAIQHFERTGELTKERI
jgi:hypothetical protein